MSDFNYFHVSSMELLTNKIIPFYFSTSLNFKNEMLPLAIRLDYHNRYMKEWVFEKIRKQHYKHMPSRWSSIFLFSTLDAAYRFQQNHNNIKERKIYKIQLLGRGKFNYVDMTYLDCDMLTYEEIEHNAHDYWSQSISDERRIEYLYEGQGEIIKEMTPPS